MLFGVKIGNLDFLLLRIIKTMICFFLNGWGKLFYRSWNIHVQPDASLVPHSPFTLEKVIGFHSVSQSVSSVAQSCLTLCNPMNRSMPGLPVHHLSKLLEFTQTHVHRAGDAIQPSHPLSSPSPPAPNPSQHQGLFQWVSSSHEVAKVLEFRLQHQSFQWTPRTDLLQDGLVGSPCSSRDSSRVFSNTIVQSINSSVLSFLHSPTLTSIPLEKP